MKWGRVDEAYQSYTGREERLGCGDGLYDFERDLCVEVCYWVRLGECVLCAAGTTECDGGDALLNSFGRNSTTSTIRL